MDMLNRLDARDSAILVFAISLATIAGAWAFELIGGMKPCPLCLQQRWAYYAVVPISLALIFAQPSLRRIGLVLCALIMLAGAVLGAYHAGVEWGFWPGPQSCAGGGGLSGGLPDFDKAKVIACNEAQWRMFGLSFAGWNVLISLAVAAVALYGARRNHGSSSVSQ